MKKIYLIIAVIFVALWIYGGRETTDIEGKYYVSFDNGITERQLGKKEAALYDELKKEIGFDYVQGGFGAARFDVPENSAMILRYYAFIDATLKGHDDRIYFVENNGDFDIYITTPQDENEVFKVSPGHSDTARAIYEELKGGNVILNECEGSARLCCLFFISSRFFAALRMTERGKLVLIMSKEGSACSTGSESAQSGAWSSPASVSE